MRALLIALLSVVALAVSATASAATTHSCAPTNRVNQFLKPDPKGLFGIFKIKVTGVSCGTADTVTNGFWNVQIKRSNAKKKLTLHGFTCVLQPADEAQQLKAACSKGSQRIRFVMEIPNG
jgi:hypothetical protein